jgi:hypothetical protein
LHKQCLITPPWDIAELEYDWIVVNKIRNVGLINLEWFSNYQENWISWEIKPKNS